MSCVFVSLNGQAQRGIESGRKPLREGSSGQPISFAIVTAQRRSTSAYSSYEPLSISCSSSRKRGKIFSGS